MTDQAVLVLGYEIQATRICQLAAMCATIYDHFLSLDQEVELIWKRKWSYSKILFLIIRYIGEAVLIANAVVFLSTDISRSVCRQYTIFQASASSVILLLMQVTLQWRIHAMYRESRKILVFLCICFSVEIISMCVLLGLRMGTEIALSEPLGLPGVHICSFTKVPHFVYGFWIAVIAFETVLFSLALWVAIQHVWQVGTWSASHILHVLLRDSFSYFLVTLAGYIACAGVWIVDPSVKTEIPESFAFAFTVIMGARLMLNLREAYWLPFATGEGEISTLDKVTCLRTMPRPASATPHDNRRLRAKASTSTCNIFASIAERNDAHPKTPSGSELDLRRATGKTCRQIAKDRREHDHSKTRSDARPEPLAWRWDERSGRVDDWEEESADGRQSEVPVDIDDSAHTPEGM
ncbi:hypothetical protein PLICRDRAFT_34750 [Plicaturopsis crispa FD-325 SS-3]|nr:hypothetical protein PLICRDRAFT_34750 [Plicaturopsis crispa FD-325 SS-3]